MVNTPSFTTLLGDVCDLENDIFFDIFPENKIIDVNGKAWIILSTSFQLQNGAVVTVIVW